MILQSVEELVLRRFNYCVIDEVDSILIDEARTPLIISGPAEKPSDRYYKAAKMASAFERDIHYTVRNFHRLTMVFDAFSSVKRAVLHFSPCNHFPLIQRHVFICKKGSLAILILFEYVVTHSPIYTEPRTDCIIIYS